MTRVAVVSYDIADTEDVKELALWRGIDEVIGSLICDYNATEDDVRDRCEDAILNALDDKAAGTA